MKNLIILLAIILVMTISFTSCKKGGNGEPEPIEEALVTPEELVGNWDFVSLVYNNNTYDDCSDYYGETLNHKVFSLVNVTTSTMKKYSICTSTTTDPISFLIEDNILTLGALVFEIVNAETFDSEILKLKMLSGGIGTNMPIGGVFTFNKR